MRKVCARGGRLKVSCCCYHFQHSVPYAVGSHCPVLLFLTEALRRQASNSAWRNGLSLKVLYHSVVL